MTLPNEERNAIVAGLFALYVACKGSTKRRIPKKWLRKKFARDVEGYTGDILKDLRNLGYANIQKGRSVTYSITVSGVKKLKELGLI